MSSARLRQLSMPELKRLLKQCGIPSTKDGIEKTFNVAITFSSNNNGEMFATVDTRTADDLWWIENKHNLKQAARWRESCHSRHNFTNFADTYERAMFIAVIDAIKPETCLIHLT